MAEDRPRSSKFMNSRPIYTWKGKGKAVGPHAQSTPLPVRVCQQLLEYFVELDKFCTGDPNNTVLPKMSQDPEISTKWDWLLFEVYSNLQRRPPTPDPEAPPVLVERLCGLCRDLYDPKVKREVVELELSQLVWWSAFELPFPEVMVDMSVLVKQLPIVSVLQPVLEAVMPAYHMLLQAARLVPLGSASSNLLCSSVDLSSSPEAAPELLLHTSVHFVHSTFMTEAQAVEMQNKARTPPPKNRPVTPQSVTSSKTGDAATKNKEQWHGVPLNPWRILSLFGTPYVCSKLLTSCYLPQNELPQKVFLATIVQLCVAAFDHHQSVDPWGGPPTEEPSWAWDLLHAPISQTTDGQWLIGGTNINDIGNVYKLDWWEEAVVGEMERHAEALMAAAK